MKQYLYFTLCSAVMNKNREGRLIDSFYLVTAEVASSRANLHSLPDF